MTRAGQGRLAVRILLSNNLPTSITRIVADTAKVFTAHGVRTTILFPVVDWLDFKWFQIQRLPWPLRLRWAARLILELVVNGVGRRTWCGFRAYDVPPSVRAERYWLSPKAAEELRGEITLVHHGYLIPHLLRGYARHGMKIVGFIHNNYELEMGSSDDQACWKTYCVELERRLTLPRLATSVDGREAAERLGIPVQRVIPGGIDVQSFRPAPRRKAFDHLTVTLYCSLHPQKGQAVGLEALLAARAAQPTDRVRWCSLGHVLPGHEGLFDHHFGYVHGEAYVRALQETDVFIYPSLFDGFPAPPLQAMACGAAVITTWVEGVRDYVEDGTNGLVCQPGEPDALRAQIFRLLGDEALRERLRAHGRRTVEAHSVERRAEALLRYLEELSGEPAMPPSSQPACEVSRL
ncbi:MAG: glycosyltransferase family 4 protein [Candidatus Omnitrophica bacterium]|nr:glycosyltransferase family 4 protein [Candidatus Omnitrophota bacterium]